LATPADLPGAPIPRSRSTALAPLRALPSAPRALLLLLGLIASIVLISPTTPRSTMPTVLRVGAAVTFATASASSASASSSYFASSSSASSSRRFPCHLLFGIEPLPLHEPLSELFIILLFLRAMATRVHPLLVCLLLLVFLRAMSTLIHPLLICSSPPTVRPSRLRTGVLLQITAVRQPGVSTRQCPRLRGGVC